jgi:hypothetical protein
MGPSYTPSASINRPIRVMWVVLVGEILRRLTMEDEWAINSATGHWVDGVRRNHTSVFVTWALTVHGEDDARY